jgi:predicted permease
MFNLRALFHKKRAEREMDDEMRFHLGKQTEQNIARGMSAKDARYAALRQFGNVGSVKEKCRDSWGVRLISELGQDIRFGLRQLRRNPGFTVVAILTLALGIGANTAIFSVVNGVLLSPLPYHEPGRLVALWEHEIRRKANAWDSYPNFLDWQREARSFQGMVAFTWRSRDLIRPGPPELVDGKEVSSAFFSTLGVKLALGRDFSGQEDVRGGAQVVIISNRLWKERFGGSPNVLGKSLNFGDADYTIVGVLPQGFHFWDRTDVYTPLAQDDSPSLDSRGVHAGILAIGRLKTGVSIAHARAEMTTIQQHLNQLYPASDQGLDVDVVPLKQQIIGNAGGTLLLLLGAVGLVLLIACANVAALLLARSSARAQEFAVRSALGAGRARMVRQVLTESILLSLAGGGAGLLIAAWGVKPVLAAVPGGMHRSQNVGLNAPVLFFAFGVSLIVGVLFGLVPAMKSLKLDLQSALKQRSQASSGRHHQAQRGLLIFQMALTLVLLVCAGLLFRTIRHMSRTDPGFNVQKLVTFSVQLPPSQMKTPSSIRSAYHQLFARIRNLPGIEAVDFTSSVPLSGQTSTIPFWLGPHKPAVVQAAPRTLYFMTGPDYLRTMGIPLLKGRFFTPEDRVGSQRVVAIDNVFARTYFPGVDPVGQNISFGFDTTIGPCRIIGVVGHVRDWGLGKANTFARSESYYPLSQDPDQWVAPNFAGSTIILRTRLDLAAAMAEVRKAALTSDSNLAIHDVRTMQDIVAGSMAPQRFPMVLLAIFAGLALALASVGIYGVISYSVSQRTHEIGIRMALGAEKADVLRMVLGQGLKLVLIGVAIGIAGAMVLTRFLSSLLYGVKPTDPLTFIAVSLILIAVALLACYIPARRAAKVDPMVALRYE